jgi:hypothetical protein
MVFFRRARIHNCGNLSMDGGCVLLKITCIYSELLHTDAKFANSLSDAMQEVVA